MEKRLKESLRTFYFQLKTNNVFVVTAFVFEILWKNQTFVIFISHFIFIIFLICKNVYLAAFYVEEDRRVGFLKWHFILFNLSSLFFLALYCLWRLWNVLRTCFSTMYNRQVYAERKPEKWQMHDLVIDSRHQNLLNKKT